MNNLNQPAPRDPANQQPSVGQGFHDALLDATHALEAALASPAPSREVAWKSKVAACLRELRGVLCEHVTATESPGGLFGDLESIEPNFHRRIERLRHEHADLLRQAEVMEKHLEHHTAGEPLNFHDVRQRCGWLLTALRHHQALEADLVFELYDVDVGVGD